jgi:leucyl aminopeptidase (aminopeptidase T)
MAGGSGPDFERIARRVLHDTAGVKPGWRVTITGRPDTTPFIDALAVESFKSGAPAVPLVFSDEFLFRSIAEVPLEYLKAGYPPVLELFRASDLIIQLSMTAADPARLSAMLPERLAARRQGMTGVRDIMLSDQRRWIGTDLPTPGQARTFGIDFPTFSDIFWRAMDVDCDTLKRACEGVRAILATGDRLRITSPKGTDLELEYGGRPLLKDDGVIDDEDVASGRALSNLPAGEVCFAPVEETAAGRVVFDLAYWDGTWMRDVEVEFGPGGVARPVRAAAGLDAFRAVIDGAGAAGKLIGELGIGLNPAVDRATGFTLVDEKFAGTVHLALGDNTFLGGKNASPLHWDILILEPTVTVGETAIIRDGRLQVR